MKYLESYKEIKPEAINVGGTYGVRPGTIIYKKNFEYMPYIVDYFKNKKISFGLYTNGVCFMLLIYVSGNLDLLPYEFKEHSHYIPLSDNHKEDESKRESIIWFKDKMFKTRYEWIEFDVKTEKDILDLKEYIDNILISRTANKFNI